MWYFVFHKKEKLNDDSNWKTILKKWYYYLPGMIFNTLLGLAGKYISLIFVLSVAWKSNRLWAFLWAAVYLFVLIAGNIGMYLFFRKKEGFVAKLYWLINIVSCFILTVAFFYIFIIG